ncbi:hypothetical protein [Halobacillus sp. H74]|uniref:hypothetical protein n=1 Tax=Halobacillus sp. H74 TaxID=3457436 RepID=UPI003FCD8169
MNRNDDMNVYDEREIPFTQIENDIIDSMSFEKPGDKLLYMCLCRMAHFQKGIFPSISKLMLMVGVSSPNTLKGQLDRLEEMGLIKVIDRGKKENGEHHTHLYKLLKVPARIRVNSVWDDEMVEQKKASIRERQKEKAAKKKAKNGTKTPPSKNDVPPSKFDVPPSKNDGPPSKFDGNQSRTYEPRIYKQDSIKESIIESDLPDDMKEYLGGKIKRLIDLDISLEQIEGNYLKHKTEVKYIGDYLDALDFALKQKSINDIDNFMADRVPASIEYNNKKRAKASNSGSNEVIPVWLNDRKDESNQKAANENQEVDTSDIAQRIAKLKSKENVTV